MKKVLIISYFYPPDTEVGSIRPYGLAKYLPEYGWNVVVLTKNSSVDSNVPNIIRTPYSKSINSIALWKRRFGFKETMGFKSQIGFSTQKNKRTSIDILINLIVEIITYPDNEKNWYKLAYSQGSKLINSDSIDAIISTSSPITCHLVAHSLSSKYNLPWIADFRDLWTQNHYYNYSSLRKSFERRLEIKTLKNAKSLVTITKESSDILAKLHPNKPIYSIPNGFDPQNILFCEKKPNREKLIISYTGSLYNGKRDPSMFFDALHQLILENKIDPERVKVRFYGPKEDWMNKEIEKYDLQKVVIHKGQYPRDKIIKKQSESHILLLLLWNDPHESSVCPAKIYEYLSAQRPIIAIGGPKGAVSNLLSETMAGIHVESLEEIKLKLEEIYEEFISTGSVLHKGIPEKINKYSHKEMAKRFAQILDEHVRNI